MRHLAMIVLAGLLAGWIGDAEAQSSDKACTGSTRDLLGDPAALAACEAIMRDGSKPISNRTGAALMVTSLHMAFGRFDKARAAIELAIRLSPQEAGAHVFASVVHLARMDYAAARDAASRAVELDPNSHDGWNNLGSALANLGQHQPALRAYYKAIQMHPSPQTPLKNRAYLFMDMKNLQRALGDVNRALKLAPGRADLFEMRADILRRRGDNDRPVPDRDRAIQDYGRAVEIDPDLHKAWAKRGDLLFKAGYFKPSAHDFLKAVRLRPRDDDYRAGLARAMGASDDPKLRAESVNQARNAVTLDPSLTNYMLLIQLQRLQGQEEEARETLYEVIETIEPARIHFAKRMRDFGYLDKSPEEATASEVKAALKKCEADGCPLGTI